MQISEAKNWYNGKKHLFYMDPMSKKTKGPELTSNNLYVRTSNNIDQATYEYSTDGKTFKSFGPTFTIAFGKWTGDRLGFFSWNEKEDAGYIDVDWFTYDYDGPKAAKK